ncbi:hypothetical protein J7384_17255 [Endozoicomonas sp. G2_1]|uniref:hypothetical protein n=1 Tax=Endozoicomonas sp. G2_1 TaxID=2821091 RepID=UPI001ADCDA82|nr:hypothetical protein [Endozoicomonas sp. G2_1]MBO9492113.1 hypothetical protein [Endozoicomonas sp. G2_1]
MSTEKRRLTIIEDDIGAYVQLEVGRERYHIDFDGWDEALEGVNDLPEVPKVEECKGGQYVA